MIRVHNYFEGDIKSSDGNILTTKKDKKLHGYGIKSIKYTASRYDGVVNIQAQNNWFELKILIPYNK
jgi:sensor histidine kinase regulating citrate/malate metabolism